MTGPASAAGVWPRIRRCLWQRPEWWMLAIGVGCWAWLIRPLFSASTGHRHGHIAASAESAMFHWAAMIGAMMFPLLIGRVRLIAGRSLWRRRNRAILLYLLGYAAPWLVYGAVILTALETLPGPYAASAALAVAACWQLTRWKTRALRACHRSDVLAPAGWRADADCLRSGCRAASFCLLNCWAIMLSCAVPSGPFLLMPAISAFTFIEQSTARPRQIRFASALLVAAIALAVPA